MKILVLDLETTGDAPPEHGVCEIGWAELLPINTDDGTPSTVWFVSDTGSCYTDPGRRIPPETSAIHHIIDSDVAGARPFLIELTNLLHVKQPDVLAAHSAKFERSFITDEMTGALPWICTYKCGLRVFSEAPSHSNMALRYYLDPVGLVRAKALPAHRAEPDAYVTAFHVKEMLWQHTVEELIQWSSRPALQVRCHIGSWRGSKWTEVDQGFLEWVSQRDFDEDVLYTVEHEMNRRSEEERKRRAAKADVVASESPDMLDPEPAQATEVSDA